MTSSGRRGIRWKLTSVLEDLDYADDIVLLSHRYQDMRAKTDTLQTTAGSLDLKISTKKTGHLRMNSRTRENIMLNGEAVEEDEHFTYLQSQGVDQRRWRGRDPSSDFKGKPGLCLTSENVEIQEHQPENQDLIL